MQAERKEMVIDLNLYALETLIQDTKSFPPGTAESLLNKVINNFEVTIYFYMFYKLLMINTMKYIFEKKNNIFFNINCFI